MTYAQPADIETSLLRELAEQEAAYATALLARAENLISNRVPNLHNLVVTDATFADSVVQIEAEAVARVFRAQEAGAGIYSSESEDGYSYRLNYQVASGLLYIREEEFARLRQNNGIRTLAALTDGYAGNYRMSLKEAFTRDLVDGEL